MGCHHIHQISPFSIGLFLPVWRLVHLAAQVPESILCGGIKVFEALLSEVSQVVNADSKTPDVDLHSFNTLLKESPSFRVGRNWALP
jgi:hypothetical protein